MPIMWLWAAQSSGGGHGVESVGDGFGLDIIGVGFEMNSMTQVRIGISTAQF